MQLAHTAPFDEMYRVYWYHSGTNESMVAELNQIATSTTRLMRVGAGDVFVDIGCNDGTLLSFVPVEAIRIGFDPVTNDYKELSQRHANIIINDYFHAKAFKKSRYGKKRRRLSLPSPCSMTSKTRMNS